MFPPTDLSKLFLKCTTVKIGSLNDFGVMGKIKGASLVAQPVKSLLAMQETGVQSLGWEDPLEKELATHSSIFAWTIPCTEKPGGLQSKGPQRVRHY